MLFNSQEFLFGFLPAALAGFFLLGRISRAWAMAWLILASLIFYAWWSPLNVAIMAPVVLINFGLAQFLLRVCENESRSHLSRALLVLGIVFNIAFLGYFKYINFARGAINDVFSADLVLTEVILPLGISFITFQKIAFLFDVHAGRIKSITLREYALFVLFFPQLIAGPIVHYRELVPQFRDAKLRFDTTDFAVGLTLLIFGLFKKLVLADNMAPLVTPIYDQAAAGRPISLLLAWMAAIGFTLQIYFDFSGYSDMALGLARFFGIRLPPNFNSPLRASSIIDFWLRWHMTLTRFLTAYIYNPLSLMLTRRRLAKGLPGFGAHSSSLGAFLYLLMFPTVLTMLISGLWHGAGYLYILWGLLHGIFLTVNHGWRLLAAKLWPDRGRYARFMTPIGFVLTFLSVVTAMVLFRSSTMGAVTNLWQGMLGLNGVALPAAVLEQMGWSVGWMQSWGISSESWSGSEFVKLTMLSVVLMCIAVVCPNTLEILARYEPALGVRARSGEEAGQSFHLWKPSAVWALAVSIIAAIGIAHLGNPSEFLYWQF